MGAIEKLDGMLIDGQEVQVGHFIGRNQRPGQDDFTNCYVKNIPLDWDDERLMKEFAQFGEIASAAVSKGIRSKKSWHMKKEEEKDTKKQEESSVVTEDKESDEKEETKEETKIEEETEKKIESLGFGFVNFIEHESAAAAVEALNEKLYTHVIDGVDEERELFVGRAQKKSERDREMRAKYEAEKMDRISKFQGVNLYVKNLDDAVTDGMLRDEFTAMGTITSARIMKDMGKDGRSRGFGFVCFSSPEEATRAVNEMNGKLIANKPIFVALAQRREVRRAQLEAQQQPPQASQQMPAPEGALTASALASASPEMQKNMIGERLYPLIHQSQPELAGKITGMLLEMDNSELLHLLESPEALKAKIDEAIQVLEAHQSTD